MHQRSLLTHRRIRQQRLIILHAMHLMEHMHRWRSIHVLTGLITTVSELLHSHHRVWLTRLRVRHHHVPLRSTKA